MNNLLYYITKLRNWITLFLTVSGVGLSSYLYFSTKLEPMRELMFLMMILIIITLLGNVLSLERECKENKEIEDIKELY